MLATYDGGVRWAVVQRLDSQPHVIDMADEATARKFYASWTEFAQNVAAPNQPDRWPQLASARITWEVMT